MQFYVRSMDVFLQFYECIIFAIQSWMLVLLSFIACIYATVPIYTYTHIALLNGSNSSRHITAILIAKCLCVSHVFAIHPLLHNGNKKAQCCFLIMQLWLQNMPASLIFLQLISIAESQQQQPPYFCDFDIAKCSCLSHIFATQPMLHNGNKKAQCCFCNSAETATGPLFCPDSSAAFMQ